MNYTPNHHLPQWVSSDRIRMDDFNDAMSRIDSGMAANAKAAETALSRADAAADAYTPDNKPYVVGSYTGDGKDHQLITLNFRPSLVIVSGMTSTPDVNDYSTLVPYFAVGTHGYNIGTRLNLNGVGFTVYKAGNYDQQLPYLNEPDRNYDYIAFR